jgi:hypothetical protein
MLTRRGGAAGSEQLAADMQELREMVSALQGNGGEKAAGTPAQGGPRSVQGVTVTTAALLYLVGVVATQLLAPAAYHSARGLSKWSQAMRFLLPVVGIYSDLLARLVSGLRSGGRIGTRLRNTLVVAGLIAVPGLVTFAGTFFSTKSLAAAANSAEAASRLVEVRSWHLALLATLVAALFADRQASIRSTSELETTKPITEKKVIAAQKAWSDGVVAIGNIKASGGDYEEAARNHIRKHYGYGIMPVLFKPTLANEVPFREDFNSALSYFVATNGVCSEDKGFAIKGWTKVRWENHKIVTHGSQATSMGNYYFTTPEGEDVKVEYTFGYFLDAQGKLRINLHHSALPYVA